MIIRKSFWLDDTSRAKLQILLDDGFCVENSFKFKGDGDAVGDGYILILVKISDEEDSNPNIKARKA